MSRGFWKDDIGSGDYQELVEILHRAYLQAAAGKGRVRHGQSITHWASQVGCRNAMHFGPGAALAQVVKKAEELIGLRGKDERLEEAYGIIVYAAMAIHAIDQEEELPAVSPVERVVGGSEGVPGIPG